jgi:cytosine/adenosine deaminase-related metal-dependent hydrolase
MATRDGADALGLGDEVGQLTAGRIANMAVIAADFSTDKEVAEAICAPASRVVGVMVAGQWLRQLA